MLEIWYAASKVATPFLSDNFLAQERENFRNDYLPDADTWVFEVEDAVVGFISLHANWVGGLFVHPRFQRRGIGNALMDQAVGLHDHVFLGVDKENRIGRSFYEQYGFTIENEFNHESNGRPQLRLSYSSNKDPMLKDKN